MIQPTINDNNIIYDNINNIVIEHETEENNIDKIILYLSIFIILIGILLFLIIISLMIAKYICIVFNIY
jgi:hypothetical protein